MDWKKIGISLAVIMALCIAGGYALCRYMERSSGGDAEATISELQKTNDDLNAKLAAAAAENEKLGATNTVVGTAITGTGGYVSSADKELSELSGLSPVQEEKVVSARADLKAASVENTIALKGNAEETAIIKTQAATITAAQKDAADEKALIEKAKPEIAKLEHKAVVKERQTWVVGIGTGIAAYEIGKHHG